jgi:hypothetical protein
MIAVDTFLATNGQTRFSGSYEQEFEDYETESSSFRCDEIGESDPNEEQVHEVDPWDWPEPQIDEEELDVE